MKTILTIQTPKTLLDEAWAEMKRARAAKESYDLAEFMCVTALRDAESQGASLTPAQYALACVHVWKGSYAKAATILRAALTVELADVTRIEVTNFLVATLSAAGHHSRARDAARGIMPLVFAVAEDFHTAQFYRNYGDALSGLGEVDAAIEQFTGAAIHYEKVQDFRRCHDVRNNLACLLIRKEKFEEAHEQIKAALKFFHSDEDAHRTALGQVYETLARAYEAEDRLDEARRAVEQSLSYLLGGEEAALIKTSRETHGRILDKLGVERVVLSQTR